MVRLTFPRYDPFSPPMTRRRADDLTLDRVREMLAAHAVTRIYMKALAPNDNSKNQPYFGGDFGVLNILPAGKPVAGRTDGARSKPIFKAPLNFWWLGGDGTIRPAPNAKLILYPQYPEVRFSGYLLGVDAAHRPSEVLGTTRVDGRFLLVGVCESGRIVGLAAGPESRLARELRGLRDLEQVGVFSLVPISDSPARGGSRAIVLAELCRISALGWISSRRLDKHGETLACAAPNCGGYTLEAELGITPNGYAEPDFHGWEIKQHGVRNFAKPQDSPITLMTPEPSDGFYVSAGVLKFLEKYGYPDTSGRANRLNFGGIFRRGALDARTELRLELLGYDHAKGTVVDATGGIALIDRRDNEAAVWRYSDMLGHWSRKHAFAVYVPSVSREADGRQYRFGATVRMGSGTSFERLLSALHDGDVYYDPGIKVEGYPAKPRTKRRSQFRIRSSRIGRLYEKMEGVEVCRGT